MFEAQQPSLCQLVDSHFVYLELFDSFIPVDHLVVGYIIASILSTSTVTEKRMNLTLESSDDHCVKLLLIGLSNYPVVWKSTVNVQKRRPLVLTIKVNTKTTCKLIADYFKSSSPVISEL